MKNHYYVVRQIEGMDLYAAYYGPYDTATGASRVAKRMQKTLPVGTPLQWVVADEDGAKQHDALGVHALYYRKKSATDKSWLGSFVL